MGSSSECSTGALARRARHEASGVPAARVSKPGAACSVLSHFDIAASVTVPVTGGGTIDSRSHLTIARSGEIPPTCNWPASLDGVCQICCIRWSRWCGYLSIEDIAISWSIAVVVPARNEAQSIGECLQAIIAATKYPGSERWRSQIVVVADSCDDSTARIARKVLGDRGVVIEASLGSVGAARRLGTAQALRYLAGRPPSSVWLANTDGDSVVPTDWLHRQLGLAAAGYEGVAGTIRLDSCLYRGRDIADELMADYFTAPDGSHPHVHGANLGVRADAYLKAGGWSDAALAEDHCLWQRMWRSGAKPVSSAAVCVQTSSRFHGRAEGGFACTLRSKVEPSSPANSMSYA